jgi:hypothetical protein
MHWVKTGRRKSNPITRRDIENSKDDECYFKLVESCLHSELAFALQMEKEDVKELIIKTIEEEK